MLSLSNVTADEKDRVIKQKELDAACKVAREMKLTPLRQQYVEECVQKKQKQDRATCESFYSDFGAKTGKRAPLFYDLPECVEAFEYKKTR